jgi:hypothetical protein
MDLAFPSPKTILREWRISRQTQDALTGLTTTPSTPGDWRFRDYLGFTRLGTASLIDLLAAHEEQAIPDPSTQGTRASVHHLVSDLNEVAAAISQALPCRPDYLSAVLAGAGLAPRTIHFDQIVRAFHDSKRSPPFRVVRRANATLVVARTAVTSTETLVSQAGKLVSYWGICTVGNLMKRLRSFKRGGIDSAAAVRILAAIPTVRWLDEAFEWFSMENLNGRVQIAIAKIFGVVDRITMHELTRGLAKRLKIVRAVPEPVMERYLREVAHCRVDGGWVRGAPELVPAALEPSEDVVIGLLLRNGGALARASLRALAYEAGLKLTAIYDIFRSSPLLNADRTLVRLVGECHGLLASASVPA